MDLHEWAKRWQIPHQAIRELQDQMGVTPSLTAPEPGNEASVVKKVRLEAARKGIILWRNNVGVATDTQGRVIRYGLANDSKRVNDSIKSSDLVGIKPDGQFIARECKRPGWHFTGTPREIAQRKFIELVLVMGGDAEFTTGD